MTNLPEKKRSHWPISVLSSISSAVNMLLPLMLARHFSEHDLGTFRIFFLYLSLLPAFSFTSGVMSGLGYWGGQAERRIPAVQASALLVLGSGLLFLIAAYFGREHVAWYFGWPDLFASLFAFALLGSISSYFFEEAVISSGRIWLGAFFYSGFEILRTSSILISLYVFGTLSSVFFAHTIVLLMKTALGYFIGYRLKLVRIQLDPAIWRGVWNYAFPVSLAWAFGVFVSSADQFILSTTISPADFAFYSVGCLSIPPILIFEHAVTRVLIPQLSSNFSKNDSTRAAFLYREAISHLGFLIIPAVAGLILYAHPLIEILFTERYAKSAHYLQLYAFTYLFLLVPYDAIARATGNSRWILKTFIVFSIISLVLAYFLTSSLGPTGALLSLLFSGALLRGYALWQIHRQTGWSFRQYFPISSLLRKTLFCVLLSAIFLFLLQFFPNPHIWFFVTAPLFALIYLIGALAIENRLERSKEPVERILFVLQNIQIGGLERMVLDLSVQLKEESSLQPFLFVYQDDPPHKDGAFPLQNSKTSTLHKSFQERNIPILSFDKGNGFSVRALMKLIRMIFREDIQVLHTHHLGGLMYASFAKVFSIGRVRIIHTQHSFIHLTYLPRYRAYERFFSLFADQLTAVSSEIRDTYEQLGYAQSKVQIIPNGVSISHCEWMSEVKRVELRKHLMDRLSSELQDRLVPQVSRTWVLYLGRLYPRKGQNHAISLWKKLPANWKERCTLILAGPESYPGEMSRLQTYAGDTTSIVFIGATDEAPLWLQACQIFMSCSESEGLPLGVLEAAGTGLPLFLSNIPGHEIFAPYSTQYEISQEQEGVAHLVELLRQCEIEAKDAGFQKKRFDSTKSLRENYSIEQMTERYVRIYQSFQKS